jgi:hypothetical protein
MMRKVLFFSLFVLSLGFTALANEPGGPEREVREAAERVRNDGERASNRGDRDGAQQAERAAREIERNRDNPDRVREIERGYNRGDRFERPEGRSPGFDRH